MELSQAEMQNINENTLQTDGAKHISISHIGLLTENREHNRYTTMLLYVIQNTLTN